MERSDFDEEYYLDNNSDVMQAVVSGKYESGFVHYKTRGYKEYRAPTFDLYEENKSCVSAFCSLGVNCEVGMVQRKFRSEPLDLLRWAGPTPESLIQLLLTKFDRIADPTEITVFADMRGEYFLKNTRYNYRWHAWEKVGETTPEDIIDRELRRLPFLSEKLIDELTEESRIFVVKGHDDLTLSIARKILDAMHTYGRPTLVYVTQGAPVSVNRVSDYLIHGTIPKFADRESVSGPTLAGYDWLALCKKVCASLGGSWSLEASRNLPDGARW